MDFEVNGCRIRIGFWFAACAALCLLADAGGMAAAGLLAVAVHESGHIVILSRCGIRIREIRFGLFDINMERAGEPRGYKSEIWIALGGPLANFTAAGLLFLVHPAWYAAPMAANLILGCFHLLPVLSMDGGQALQCVLCMKLHPDRAAAVMKAVSVLVLLPLAAGGFFILLRTRYNFTLLFVSCYLLLCFLTHAEK